MSLRSDIEYTEKHSTQKEDINSNLFFPESESVKLVFFSFDCNLRSNSFFLGRMKNEEEKTRGRFKIAE